SRRGGNLLLRSRCARLAARHAGHSQPSQPGADGMGVAFGGLHSRQDRRAHCSMIDIVVPDEQEGTRAVVKSWLKQVGDAVRRDDPIVELETDKVAVEIASPGEGLLSEILFEDGSEVEPGTVLGRITQAGAGTAPGATAVPPVAAKPVTPQRVESH